MPDEMASDTKQKKKHMKVVRPKLRLFRAKEPVLSVFMWGVNHSINELHHINVPVMLMPDDFKAHSKIRVDNHLFNKENMPSHFKFKEYCPLVFRNLRERFNINDEDYMDSLTKHSAHETDSAGRSGARFYVSFDRKIVIKTIGGEEVMEMHRILKDYHQDSLTKSAPIKDAVSYHGYRQLTASYDKRFVVKKIDSEDVAKMHKFLKDYHKYIVERHAETLLPHFLGMYRVTVNDNETYLVVMRNIFSPRLNVHKKYDLKGSTVQREASHKEKAKDLPTYKDIDFMNDGIKIYLGEENKATVMDTITADVEFLTRQNLMDYSLLVGIHDADRAELEVVDKAEDSEENGFTESEEDIAEQGGAVGGSVDGVPTPPDSPMGKLNAPDFTGEFDDSFERFAMRSTSECPRKEIYFLALIDILTHYGMKKRSAQAAKTVKYGAGAEISTVKPEQYARRFVEFIDKNIV